MSVPSKAVSRSVKRNLLLRRRVEKPIHDPDITSNVSEVSTSRMAKKNYGDEKKAQPHKKKGQGCGCFPCCRRRKPKETITVPVPDDTDGKGWPVWMCTGG
jgi:hypothetical protein